VVMVARSRVLVIHGQDPEAWAERYGIEPFSYPCSDCGKDLTTTVPFALGELRGLFAPACSCGNEQTPYCVVRDPKHGDLFTPKGTT
jgi:hypothetical protein